MAQEREAGQPVNRKTVLLYIGVGLFVLFLALSSFGAFSTTHSVKGTEVAAFATARYGPVLVVGPSDHRLNQVPLYEFSGDVTGHVGCGTTSSKGLELGAKVIALLSCSGPQSDFLNDVTSDDWPALTSKGPPLAGPGVNPKLLGRIFRRGIGYQVTYGGHPLYLFDQSSKPFHPQGVGYVETVSPLPPWHGYWYLANAASGAPASGVAAIAIATLPNHERVMGVVMEQNVASLLVTLYQSSGSGRPPCGAVCRGNWVPVYSSTMPHVRGSSARLFGLRRAANGALAVTYRGSLLYMNAREKVSLVAGSVDRSGTSGNANGAPGPGGTMHVVKASP